MGWALFGGSFRSGTLAAVLWVGTTNGDVAAFVVSEVLGSQDGSPRKMELLPTSMCVYVWCVCMWMCGVCVCVCVYVWSVYVDVYMSICMYGVCVFSVLVCVCVCVFVCMWACRCVKDKLDLCSRVDTQPWSTHC